MMRALATALMLFVPMASVFAVHWKFEPSVDVPPTTPGVERKVFHHLDSSGRRNIAVSARGVAVGWEDDRDGSPRVYLAFKRWDKAHFESEVQVSDEGEGYEPSLVALAESRFLIAWEEESQVSARVAEFGDSPRLGPIRKLSAKSGAQVNLSRVALGSFSRDVVFAAWADKRHFRDGYDIWGAVYSPGKAGFGSNEKVQDDFGGLAKQRHATVAGHVNGTLVVAWGDEREDNADVMLSWREDGQWSEDWPLPEASGAGHQSHPSIALDNDGNLHVAWVERDKIGGATRLKYAFGKLLVD